MRADQQRRAREKRRLLCERQVRRLQRLQLFLLQKFFLCQKILVSYHYVP